MDKREREHLRYWLKKFGYQLTSNGHQTKIYPDRRGFRITNIESGEIILGRNYDLSIVDVGNFLKKEYERWSNEKREEKRLAQISKRAGGSKKIAVMHGGWIVTNDKRAIRALGEHENLADDNIAEVMYRAYRPYACPSFSRVWPKDGDSRNLTDWNLVSDADETDLPPGIIPVTSQRRIWHNDKRIFIKLPIRDELFFTAYDPELFQMLCSPELSGWYIQTQKRKTKTAFRLYCRVQGQIVSLAEIVALWNQGGISPDDITRSIREGKEWLRNEGLEVDHLKDNAKNNCPHNLCIMADKSNHAKLDSVTSIMLPYVFLPVKVGNEFRVLCGKADYSTVSDDYGLESLQMISCRGIGRFLDCLKAFKEAVKQNGDMLPRPEDQTVTNCVAQMLVDDGELYQNGKYNPIEQLLRADSNEFTPWNGVFDGISG